MVEETLYVALEGLVAGRIFPDIAPPGTVTPYGTYQQVGGQDTATLRGVAQRQNARMQVNIWAETRIECTTIMNQVIAALTGEAIGARPYGAAVSLYEDDTKLFGARQDFSIWFIP